MGTKKFITKQVYDIFLRCLEDRHAMHLFLMKDNINITNYMAMYMCDVDDKLGDRELTEEEFFAHHNVFLYQWMIKCYKSFLKELEENHEELSQRLIKISDKNID